MESSEVVVIQLIFSALPLLSSKCCIGLRILLGSQFPPAPSQKTPPLEIRAIVHRDVAPVAVAHSMVPADQRANDWCSCVQFGEYKPFII
jgi:hypothetical protein